MKLNLLNGIACVWFVHCIECVVLGTILQLTRMPFIARERFGFVFSSSCRHNASHTAICTHFEHDTSPIDSAPSELAAMANSFESNFISLNNFSRLLPNQSIDTNYEMERKAVYLWLPSANASFNARQTTMNKLRMAERAYLMREKRSKFKINSKMIDGWVVEWTMRWWIKINSILPKSLIFLFVYDGFSLSHESSHWQWKVSFVFVTRK